MTNYEGLIERLERKSEAWQALSKYSFFPENRDRLEATAEDYDQAITAIRSLVGERENTPSISNRDAELIREMLDDIDVWDGFDKAVDRMLSKFPNDPLRQALIEEPKTQKTRHKDG